MTKTAVALTSLLTIGYMLQGASSQCKWTGFGGCECNILGACDIQGNPVAGLDNMLTGYAPQGLEQFRYDKSPLAPPNLAYLCEGGTVTIMYDCNARIPLYAATVMDASQINNAQYQRSGTFGLSGDKQLNGFFQQTNSDYKDSNKRHLCYESSNLPPGQNYLQDTNWFAKKNPGQKPLATCGTQPNLKSIMAKGHLVAAGYGRGSHPRIQATFTYTNAVPQFGSFNSGQWLQNEKRLITWGQRNCATNANQNARMFIVVGAIPSTFGKSNPRFFGESGFSDFEGVSRQSSTYAVFSGKKDYRVNVPTYMWTAACCTFQYVDGQGQIQDETSSTAFYRENHPGNAPCTQVTVPQMLVDFKKMWPGIVVPQIFPKNANC